MVFPKMVSDVHGYRCVTMECTHCGRKKDFILSEDSLNDYYCLRYHVQECFPTLDAPDRELFVSGLCPSCWNDLIGPVPSEDLPFC